MDRFNQIVEGVRIRFPEYLLHVEEEAPIPVLRVDRRRVVPSLSFLCEAFSFESLMCETASDRGEVFVMIYHLFSTRNRMKLVVKTELPREDPVVETAEEIWRAANWYEREIYDLFGIEFIGHSDLTRILLPPDWEGHPLRKDYRPAPEYHGMKIEW